MPYHIPEYEIEKANKEEWFGISISDDEKKEEERILFYIHASDIDAMWDKLHTAERKLYKGEWRHAHRAYVEIDHLFKCPYCNGIILNDDYTCKNCGYDFKELANAFTVGTN